MAVSRQSKFDRVTAVDRGHYARHSVVGGGRGAWNLRLKVCGGSVKFRRLPAQCIQRRSWPVHVDAIPGCSSVPRCLFSRTGEGRGCTGGRGERERKRSGEGSCRTAKEEEKRRKKEQENAEMFGRGLGGEVNPRDVRGTKVGAGSLMEKGSWIVRDAKSRGIGLKLNRRQWPSFVSVRDVRSGL